MANSLQHKALSGFAWSLGERLGSAAGDFVITLIIARVLLPEEFGLVAMVTIFLSLATALIDSGLGRALIRRQEVSEVEYATVFWWNTAVAVLVYALIYLAAPAIAGFYGEAALVDILRIIGLIVIIQALGLMPMTLLTKQLQFRALTLRALVSQALSGALGLYLAFEGWGYWALVVRQLSSALLSTALLWISSRWIPRFVFSVTAFRSFFGFGSRLLLAGLLDALFNNLYPLLIGKFFSAASLGLYNRANGFRALPQNMVTSVVSKVTYPLLAQVDKEAGRLRSAYAKLIQAITFLYFPLLFCLLGVSKPLVLVLLTEKWLAAVPLLKGLLLAGLLYPVHALNMNVLMVSGRSDLFLRLEVMKKALVVGVILLSFQWGLMGLVYGQVVQSWLAFGINTYYTDKLIGYSMWQQLRDLGLNLLGAAVMGGLVLAGCETLGIYTWWSLGLWMGVGAALYLGLMYLLAPGYLRSLAGVLRGWARNRQPALGA